MNTSRSARSFPFVPEPARRRCAASGACALAIVVSFVLALVGACAPNPADTMNNPTAAAQLDSTPMPLDPTAPVIVEGWWSNGRQLLHLADDGAYQLWSGTNRFDEPHQNGRWSRLNYKALMLEPYGIRVREQTRCELDRNGSEVRLLIPGLDSMVRFEAAPGGMEERMLGLWKGPGGTLLISSDGRYRAEAPAGAGASPGSPIALAGHAGRWIVDRSTLLLLPDSPTVPPVLLALEAHGEKSIRLRAGDGAYHRVPVP
ncbi:MAG: hypothetical protein FJ253_02600 [Phycisphaerae bacterium]|nr:hypothetical protein [Phycisphaerae bacterium]